MFYALFKSSKLIGIFDTEENVNNMINGLQQNKLCKEKELSVRKFNNNSICEFKDNNNNNNLNNNNLNNNIEQVTELSFEEEEKRNKEKCEVEYELNNLKKNKDKIDESKKTYKVDLDLYQKFKKLKNNSNEFEIPQLFIEKYRVFEMIENDNNLNWENFYTNYKPEIFLSSYGNMFDNGDARTINI